MKDSEQAIRDAANGVADALAELLLAHHRAVMETIAREIKASDRPTPLKEEVRAHQSSEKKSLLNVREAAEYLGLSERTVYRWTKPRGPLQSIRMGSQVRYDIADLKAWIQDQKN